MSWLDTRTAAERAYDNAWYQAGVTNERKAIVAALESWLQQETIFKTLEEMVDWIERGGHHE